MNQNNNTKDIPSIHSRKGWLSISIGLILALLALIGFTGKTPIGTLLVFSLSYLFGVFYHLILAFMFVFGLRLIISRRLIPFKGQSLLWVGTILIFLSALAFGSYSIYASQADGIPLSDFASLYNNRMLSFASGPWGIDNYTSLPSLGGGYIGLFILCLFGSIWHVIGNAIVFSILLFVGLAFLFFRPVRYIIACLKDKKNNQVKYSSPYRRQSNKDQATMRRTIDEDQTLKMEETPISHEPSPELSAPFNDRWTGTSIEQGSFTPVDGSLYNPDVDEIYDENISAVEDDFHITQSAHVQERSPLHDFSSETSYQDDNSAFRQVESTNDMNSSYETSSNEDTITPTTPTYVPQHSSYANENSSIPQQPTFTTRKQSSYESESFSQPEPQQDFVSTPSYSSYQQNTTRYEEPQQDHARFEENVSVNQVRVDNPLQNVNRSAPLKENRPQEFSVLRSSMVEEVEPNVQEPALTLSEDEIEHRKEQEYFARKQKAKAEALLEKKRQKEEKIASLMKYVTDVPKRYNYALPSDALLSDIDDSAKVEKNTQSAQEKATIINKVFDEFGVKAQATTFTIGASVTRFNVETQHGEKADKIANLTNEFQRALNGDKSVRVETVVEGRSTSGIEVGNIAPMAVAFKDMFIEIEQDTTQPLLLPIGKDISGNIITFALNKMPHMLVAGTTGSGKSVLIHSMIMTIIMRTYPSQAKLMLIDPKQVEFIRYEDEPHLFCPVINKPESAILALKKLCEEMDRRFTVLSKCRCANLEDYNDMRRGHESQYEEMPYIVTVIDEFADLMQTGGSEVTQSVTRIAQKARACGIHLIIATQRPSKDTVPMIIKANVPCRIGLSCSSQIDSRVILDENGAETLLGKGDLLFKCPGKKSLIRAQSPFISNGDIRTIIEYVREKAGDPVYNPNFLDLEVEKQEEVSVNPEGDLYNDIREYVIETGITSKASIMRSFQVSSSKADQFISRLQSEAVITFGPNGKYVLGPAAHLEDFQ